ncbi:hypothetical protein PLICRDRAFT_588667 [Plicaturopsis crispa FD-325 SS-3]|nr:hypothetical protein PLICRDRAFT_588667 [Plicaturopsis crispa FD-325 SS-3]
MGVEKKGEVGHSERNGRLYIPCTAAFSGCVADSNSDTQQSRAPEGPRFEAKGTR